MTNEQLIQRFNELMQATDEFLPRVLELAPEKDQDSDEVRLLRLIAGVLWGQLNCQCLLAADRIAEREASNPSAKS